MFLLKMIESLHDRAYQAVWAIRPLDIRNLHSGIYGYLWVSMGIYGYSIHLEHLLPNAESSKSICIPLWAIRDSKTLILLGMIAICLIAIGWLIRTLFSSR